MLPAGYTNAVAVTPSDTAPVISREGVAHPFAAVFCGTVTAGQTVTVITVGGQTVTFTNPVQGAAIYIRGTHVKATGTTATNLVALW